jgi:hypothetical protein
MLKYYVKLKLEINFLLQRPKYEGHRLHSGQYGQAGFGKTESSVA